MRSALVWTGLLVLVALGVTTSVLRVLAIAGVQWVTDVRLATTTSLVPEYVEELPRLEKHFADSAPVVLTHVVTGGVFLSLGLLQLSARIRDRHVRFHRVSGPLLVALAIFAGLTGLWLGVVEPYSPTERIPSAAAGVLFLVAPSIAIIAIRRGDVRKHREWMIRFFTVGAAIVVIRLVTPLIIWLRNAAPYRDIVGLTFWAGWLVSLVVAEVWIRYTRADAGAYRSPAPVKG